MATITQRHLTIHVNVKTDNESSFESDLSMRDPLSADGLAQETSTPDSGKLFAMRFPSRESSDRFAYIDTYNNVLRYDSDDEKRGLSAIMSIRNVTPPRGSTDPIYHLSTIVNPLSFLTPVGNAVNGIQQMRYSYFGVGENAPPTFKVLGRGTTLSFSTLVINEKAGVPEASINYLTPEVIDRRPQIVGSTVQNYNTEVYVIDNYTYDTLPVAK